MVTFKEDGLTNSNSTDILVHKIEALESIVQKMKDLEKTDGKQMENKFQLGDCISLTATRRKYIVEAVPQKGKYLSGDGSSYYELRDVTSDILYATSKSFVEGRNTFELISRPEEVKT